MPHRVVVQAMSRLNGQGFAHDASKNKPLCWNFEGLNELQALWRGEDRFRRHQIIEAHNQAAVSSSLWLRLAMAVSIKAIDAYPLIGPEFVHCTAFERSGKL